jgi:hypothetical protein
MALVARVRCSFPGKDAGSVRIQCDTGATEDAVLGTSSAAWRHSRYFAKPSWLGYTASKNGCATSRCL